jgi:ATP-binding cassette subfamily C protein LapB
MSEKSFLNQKLQEESSRDSLLQALVIITKLNNKPFTAEALIEGLPTEKGQAKPELFSLDKPKSGFSRAAARAGFSSKLVKRAIKDISPLVLPCILILKENKACILEEFDVGKQHAKIILPEFDEGEIWVDVKDLEKEYLGFAFYLKKTYRHEEKEDIKLEDKAHHWFWGTLWKSKKIYIDVIFASLVINIFVLASPLFTMNVYDRVVPNNAIETLWVLAIGVVTVYLLDIFLKFIRAYFLEIAGKKSDVIMSSIIFEKVMNLSMSARPKSVGSFANNLKEFESIRGFLHLQPSLLLLICLLF